MDERVNDIINEINGLKIILRDNDYKTIKYVEGCISEEEFSEYKKKRAEYRARINELEKELNLINK